jgi:hypothetical protein
VREASDPGAGWQEVPWAHQGHRHFQVGDGLQLKLRRERDAGARLATEAEPCAGSPCRFEAPRLAAYGTDGTVE